MADDLIDANTVEDKEEEEHDGLPEEEPEASDSEGSDEDEDDEDDEVRSDGFGILCPTLIRTFHMRFAFLDIFSNPGYNHFPSILAAGGRGK